MANFTIDQLLDGKNTRLPFDKVHSSQSGISFKESSQANPDNLKHIVLQTQLETLFGVNIELFDDSVTSMYVDESFGLNKSINLGDNTALELRATVVNNGIQYSGATEMFQNIDPADVINTLFLREIILQADTPSTRKLFNLVSPETFFMNTMITANFDEIGLVDSPLRVSLEFAAFFNINKGLIIKNPGLVNINSSEIQNFGITNITFLSFIMEQAAKITINTVTGRGLGVGGALLFLDPNSPVGTSFTVKGDSNIDSGDFYQKGVNIDIDSITDNAGFAVYNTATDHNLQVGDKIKHSGFVTVLNANDTKLVTVLTSNTAYETGDAFGVTDSGVLENRPVNVISVAGNGSGQLRLTTDISHGLVVGKVVVLRNFGSYNQTATVILVDTPLSGTEFDVDITFTGTEAGLVDAASLDQSDSRVIAQGNSGQQNSMIQGEMFVNTVGITVVSSPSTPVPLENLIQAANDFVANPENELVRLNTTTGESVYEGTQIVRVVPTYTIGASKTGGGTQVLEFALFHDLGLGFIEVPNTRITFDTSVDTEKTFSGTFFNMNPQDKFKLFKVSNNGTDTTDISSKTKLMLLGENP